MTYGLPPPPQRNSGKVLIWLLVLIICFGIIAGCPKRSRDKTKTGSSIPEWSLRSPVNLTATAFSSSRIDLSWELGTNGIGTPDGYQVESRQGGTGAYIQIATVSADTTSYSDPGPFLLTTYYYRVRAYNTMNDLSAYSNEVSVTISPPEWAEIAAGESHSLALTTNNMLWVWGSNLQGQLGLGDTSPLTVTNPTLLGQDTDWSIIAAGSNHTLALKSDPSGGTLWVWGLNDDGQLGIGDTDYFGRTEPTQVGSDSDWLGVAGGGSHTIALKTDGTLWSWGRNAFGQLGLGDTDERITPSLIGTATDWFTVSPTGTNLASVECGYDYSLALKSNRTLWAWGFNYFGQLGDNSTTNRTTPRSIGTTSDWSLVSAGYNHTIGLKTDSTLWGWGYGYTSAPRQIGIDSDWVSASAGGENVNTGFTIARKSNGTLWSWGFNASGQLGLGDNNQRTAPVQITYPDEYRESWALAAAGGAHSLGITASGSLWAWGGNNLYQLGLGNTTNQNMPINLNLPQPGNLIATVITWTRITLSWFDNSLNETGFIIERSTDGINYALRSTLSANATSYSDETVTRGNAYYYRVKASYPGGDSAYSNVSCGFTRFWEWKLGPPPSARYAHSMVWDPAGAGRLIMFGGYDASGNLLNDLWAYDPAANNWALLTPSGTLPSARRFHSMVWDPAGAGRLIMFGGSDASGNLLNDLWAYDPAANNWALLTPSGTPPSARSYHSMVWDGGGNRLIMFGGYDASGYKNDLWWWW